MQLIRVGRSLAIDQPNDKDIRLGAIPSTLATTDSRRRDHRLADAAADEVLAEAREQLAGDILMELAGSRCHEQLAVDDLVPLPVVGQCIEHLNGPIADRCGHTHRLKHSAKEGQVSIARMSRYEME